MVLRDHSTTEKHLTGPLTAIDIFNVTITFNPLLSPHHTMAWLYVSKRLDLVPVMELTVVFIPSSEENREVKQLHRITEWG